MKIKLGAVIPTVQYGNLQPEFEIDANSESMTDEKALERIEAHIQALWDKYGEKPLTKKSGSRKLIKAFIGGDIYYDDATHTYTNEKGDVYTSGSEYAKRKQKPFDAERMSKAVSDKFGVNPVEIANLWERAGGVSRDFGTTVHEALEIYGKYKSLADSVGKEYATPGHPVLKEIVESFFKGKEKERAEYEVVVVDHEAKRAGTIDRLIVTGPKSCILTDFKITPKEDLTYWADQLEFYASILQAAGWKVEKKLINQYNGGWREVEV